ncbi:DUF4386 domain-containing protein [Flavobacterium sp. LB2P84]|uniref:DUF4386 domain-containing protein n=1 Tax=Flavobacterium yafengii TaxID=3041253 RepID=UPI0024A7C314|nr:DUF4386 domain-containing protein [Flavobacterium yafengii]MDI6033720.1 DUF4386 domain-containing protein [Flavobacterium yafengii]
MNSIRKNAIIVGVLFILAAVSAIIGLALYQPILNDPDFIIKGAANNTQVIWGAFFELILAFSVIGISYMMYPILKKKNENIAIGYVCFRLLEGTIVVIGIISLLSLVTLNQDFSKVSNQNVSSFLIAGKLLVAVHNWTFLFGPNFALGPSTLMMSYFLYKSKLVPRYISIFGLVGGPLIFTSAVLVMFGVFLQVSVWGAILAIPVFAYEMSLAIWLIVKGFNSTQLANSCASV